MSNSAPSPTPSSSRIEAIDTLRGVALLGILTLNIIGMGMPFEHYFNPAADGRLDGGNLWAWITTETLFEGSFRTLFSMLFGASILIFTTGPRAKSAAVHYRRTLLLIAFGVIDGFLLLWPGDILVVYGLAGLLLYFARNWLPRRQLIVAGVLLLLMSLVYGVFHLGVRQLEPLIGDVQSAQAAGQTLTAEQQGIADGWAGLTSNIYPSPAAQASQLESFATTSYFEAVRLNGSHMPETYMQIPIVQLWDALMMMLLGMALYQLGVLSAAKSARTYWWMVIGGLGVGWGVNAWEVYTVIESNYATHWLAFYFRPTYDLGRLATAIGYLGIVMLFCQSSLLPWLRRALTATGRMALTNYLMHSLIAMLLFRGFALGWHNELSRPQLLSVVVGIWILQLWLSPWWLRRFQFGPVEWLWRALTYGKAPPMRRPVEPT